MTNLERYKTDLKALIQRGIDLQNAMSYECAPSQVTKQLEERGFTADKLKKFIATLPSFKVDYQPWYSESLAIIELLLPNRVLDFRKYYERPKSRKSLEHSTYSMEDYFLGLHRTNYSGEEIVGPSTAITLFQQQLSILKSVEKRFESSLFDIEQLVQSDLLDSELDGAKELLKNKFTRASGVIAGVVLEKHLAQVCKNHSVLPSKKNPTISDFNEQLKNNNVIDTPTWRAISLYADIRNICGHGKGAEPTNEQVLTLIEGVEKLTKTLF